MSWTARTDPKDLEERSESIADLQKKAAQLADMISRARHVVFFTGAGLSTATGIPDFRGPTGVWTLAAQNRKPSSSGTKIEAAVPSTAHMCLVSLMDWLRASGRRAYVVSQNVDGLHRKSGVPSDQLSELHGNCLIERCERCNREFSRDYSTRDTRNGVFAHYTGRCCAACGGKLVDGIVNFGEDLPADALQAAFDNSDAADLHIVLGSSLTVSPANDCPRRTKKRGGKVVICNLQRTPLDNIADMRIFARTDDLMALVMGKLSLTIPEWRLCRRVRIRTSAADATRCSLTVDSLDDGLPASIIKSMIVCEVCPDGTSSTTELTAEPFVIDVKQGSLCRILVGWYQHYREPALLLTHTAAAAATGGSAVRTIDLSFSIPLSTWRTESDVTVDA